MIQTVPEKKPAGNKPWTIYKDLTLVMLLLLLIPGTAWYWMNKGNDNYFRNPLNIPVRLSANFGELRKDHFHMGLDIRTKGKENLDIHAAADGYISRVSIEEKGFGRAIYITHPNNTTTLYAHLNYFYGPLEKMVRDQQCRDQQWEQDILCTPGMFPVQKGTFIGYSGNTGASEGPHLHFEVRDTRTGNNLDPLIAGLRIPDDLPPVLRGLYWYNRQYSTYQGAPKQIAITGNNNLYHSNTNLVKVSSPLISFGLQARDKSPDARSLLGIAHAAIWMDGSLVHSFSLNNFSYADTRFINACIDYTRWTRSGSYIQHLSTLPGNKMPAFATAASTGTINLSDRRPHQIIIRADDAFHNQAQCSFQVQYDGSAQTSRAVLRGVRPMIPGKENLLNSDHVQVRFSRKAFYDTVPFIFQEQQDGTHGKASWRIQLHNASVPVHDSFEVRIKTSLPDGDPLRKKTILQWSDGANKEYVPGKWQGDWMAATCNKLGTVQLLIDTMAPAIGMLQWEDSEAPFTNKKLLRIQCADNMGPVAGFRAELDGQWLLFERKGNCFTYRVDDRYKTGARQLVVVVTDLAGNVTTKKFSMVAD